MGIALKELLAQEFFRDFRVIAGKNVLDREIQGIAIMDSPDAFRWSKGKELVMTSGYAISREPGCIRAAFADGSIKKTAALMIKRQRYLDDIPQDVIDLFELHGIPLVSMPFEVAYMDVQREVNVAVMNRAIRRFRIQDDRVFQLSDLSYKDHKIRKILQAVEAEMHFPAFLYDLGEKKSYYSSRNFQGIMRRLGLSQSELWNPEREHSRHTLCDYLSMVRLRLIEAAEPDAPRVSWVLMPIQMNDAVQAYFVVMESREFLDYYDEYSIRIAFLLLQSVYEQIAAARSVGDVGFENFALFVCNAASEDAAQLSYQASQQGISVADKYVALYFSQRNTALCARRQRRDFLQALVQSGLGGRGRLVFLEENEGLVLIADEGRAYARESYMALAEAFAAALGECCAPMDFVFALSGGAAELWRLKQSVERCRNIVRMGRRLYPQRQILDYEALGPFTWLQIPEEELDAMLAEYRALLGDEKNAELLKTLKAYLENNMNYSLAAAKTYVHINTVRKRIAQVEKLLQIDWDDYVSRWKTELLLQLLGL